MIVTPRRALFASLLVIFGASALAMLGVIGTAVQLAIQAMTIGYSFGRLHESGWQLEQHRVSSVAAIEEFLVQAHEHEDEIDEDDREAFEHAVSTSQEMLALMDAQAPPSVKLKRWRERRRAR